MQITYQLIPADLIAVHRHLITPDPRATPLLDDAAARPTHRHTACVRGHGVRGLVA
jgi:hypothetical protein